MKRRKTNSGKLEKYKKFFCSSSPGAVKPSIHAEKFVEKGAFPRRLHEIPLNPLSLHDSRQHRYELRHKRDETASSSKPSLMLIPAQISFDIKNHKLQNISNN